MLMNDMTDSDNGEAELDEKAARTTNGKTAGGKVTYRGGKAKALGQHIGRLTKRAFGRRGFADGAIIADWPSVIGEHLAELSEPERITYPQGKRSGGTLHLRIASGSIAVELQHLEPLLIERINGYFGYKAVEKVRLIQAPLAKIGHKKKNAERPPLNEKKTREVAQILSDVDDPELREALDRLARAIVSRSPD